MKNKIDIGLGVNIDSKEGLHVINKIEEGTVTLRSIKEGTEITQPLDTMELLLMSGGNSITDAQYDVVAQEIETQVTSHKGEITRLKEELKKHNDELAQLEDMAIKVDEYYKNNE